MSSKLIDIVGRFRSAYTTGNARSLVITCVYYDDGNVVASDGKCLALAEYHGNLNGCVGIYNNQLPDYKYPKWRRITDVVDKSGSLPVHMSFSDFYDLRHKAFTYDNFEVIDVLGEYISKEYMETIIEAFEDAIDDPYEATISIAQNERITRFSDDTTSLRIYIMPIRK